MLHHVLKSSLPVYFKHRKIYIETTNEHGEGRGGYIKGREKGAPLPYGARSDSDGEAATWIAFSVSEVLKPATACLINPARITEGVKSCSKGRTREASRNWTRTASSTPLPGTPEPHNKSRDTRCLRRALLTGANCTKP